MPTTPISWPHPPRDPSGNWAVQLPGNASIGEVKLWAQTLAAPVTTTGYRWKCDETTLPLLEAGGFNHQLTSGGSSGGTVELSRTSMRADSTGHAATTGTGHDVTSLWTPSLAVTGADFAIAGLLGPDTGAAGASYGYIGLQGILRFDRFFTSGTLQNPLFNVWNGTGWSTAAAAPTAPGTGSTFFAFRASPGGVCTYWWGDNAGTNVTSGVYAPASTTQITTFVNDVRGMKFQEIHAWLGPATDGDILAVRLDLIGV